jgi:indole-3-pyruvate monooxygenase
MARLGTKLESNDTPAGDYHPETCGNTEVLTMTDTISTRVVIVGAGPAGLAVGACLQHAGIPFVMLERAAQIGISWRNHYERLHLHTAKRFSALPYLPFPADYPRYPSRQQMIDYLELYAQRFQLQPRFNQNVLRLSVENGHWQTQTEDFVYSSDFVVMATGLNESPTIPTWPDQERFKGPILHSSSYRNGEPYRGQNVLVVGFGNSGTEIALDLTEHGAIPAMSVRSPINVVFRDRFGIPVQLISIAMSPLPSRVIDAINRPILRMAFGDLSPYGLQQAPYGATTQVREQGKIPVIDIGTIGLIKQGKIKVYPGIERFTEDGLIFSDGKRHAFDAVILATGYHVKLNNLISGQAVFDVRGYPVESGRASSLPGLYFCGFQNSAAGLLRKIRIEAKGIARDIAGKL